MLTLKKKKNLFPSILTWECFSIICTLSKSPNHLSSYYSLYFVTSLSGYDCGYTSLAVYGAAVLEHCLMEEGFPENAKIGKGFNLEEG